MFELGEDLFDRIKIWAVGRQKEQMRSGGANGITGGLALMTAEIVENDDLASIEPPWYGPVCSVVWEGWRRETSPYPDRWPKTDIQRAAANVCCRR